MENTQPTRWKSLLVLFTIASLFETMFYSQFLAFTPLYLPELGITTDADIKYWVGVMSVVINAVGIPFLPFWGALADRYSRKPIIVRTFIILTVTAVILYLAGNIWVFLIARAVNGLALGNSGLMMTTLTERLPKDRIGYGFAIMNAAAPVGAFIGPLVGGPVVDNYGFQTLILINVFILAAVTLAMGYGYEDPYEGGSTEPLLKMAWDSVMVIFRSPRLRALFPALFLLFGSWMLAFVYVPLAVEELYNNMVPTPAMGPATATGVVIGAGGFITIFLSPYMGAQADKRGVWKVLFIGSVAALVLWPIPFFMNGLVAFGIAWIVLNGVVSSIFALSFNALSVSIANNMRGRVMAMAYMPVNIGFLFGAWIGIQVTHNSVFNVFPVATLMTFLGILLLYVAYRQPDPVNT